MKTAIVRHILVKDKDTAGQLKKKILAGADFSKIAKQYSTCNSAKRGGELGEVKKGQLVPVIDIVKLLYYSYKIRKKLEITHRLSRSTILYAYV